MWQTTEYTDHTEKDGDIAVSPFRVFSVFRLSGHSPKDDGRWFPYPRHVGLLPIRAMTPIIGSIPICG